MTTFLSFSPLIIVMLFMVCGAILIVGHEIREAKKAAQKNRLHHKTTH
jgi:hypothetical protein